MNDITPIPLNKLTISEDNVRKTVTPGGIAELAASLMAHGLKQNLVVRKEGKNFAIIDGKRRFMAYMQLVDAGRVSDNLPVPCLIDETSIEGKEISLIANTMREDMHPADEFEAFRDLADKGIPTADIAARSGCDEAHVIKLLKLGRVSPSVLQLYREDKLKFDHIMALTLTDDHARQEQIVADMPGHWTGREIRRVLTENDLPVTDKRVKFVTEKVYEKEEGGVIKRDLFADFGNGGYVTNVPLLDRLAGDKLSRAAEAIRKEGWNWVETHLDFGYEEKSKFQQLHGEEQPLPKKLQKEADKLRDEYDELCDSDDAKHIRRCEAIDARMARIEAERGPPVFEAKQLAIAGAVVTIGEGGKAQVVRGLVRPEDMPKQTGKSKAKAPTGNGTDEDVGRGEFTASLIEELTAQKSAAISAVMLKQPSVVLAAVVYTIASDIFIERASAGSSLQISASQEYFRKVEGSKALAQISAARDKWSKTLPREPEKLWQWCLKQKQAVLLNLLACCAALTADAIRTKQDRPDCPRLEHADQFATALKLDMTDWFTPTADNYFGKVGKPQIIGAIEEVGGTLPSGTAKKADMAKMAEHAVAGKGWLPKLLRLTA